MIKYNDNTINKWYHDGELIKVYYHDAVCYYKLTPSGQTPCFAVVADISQYSDTEFIDVFNQADGKWYKLNNLNAYEEYGVYGSSTATTYYDGKLSVYDGYEYMYSGSSWQNIGEISGSSRVPIGYTEVEYIENESVAYINTSFKPNQDTRVIARMQTVTSMMHARFLGAGAWNRSNGYQFDYENYYDGQLHISWGAINGWSTYSYYGDYNAHTYDWNKNVFTIDNGVFSAETTYTSFQCTDNLGLFVHIYNGKPCGDVTPWTEGYERSFLHGRLYSCQIYDNGTLVRDMIPCTRDSDSKAGVYDIVNDVFYSSAYSGYEFTAGSASTSVIYPLYYPVIQDPPNNLSFSSMTEAEDYQCPWVGMKATIAGENYIFSGDSQSGYEWVIAPIDYTKTYLTFEPISSAVNFRNSTKQFQYSLDFGSTWTALTTANTVTVNVGQKLMVKGSFTAGSDNDNGNKFIASGGTWKAYGNVLSVIGSDNYTATTAISDSQLINLFRDCTTLVDVDNLKMPAYTAGGKAIRGMFRNCSGLVHVPSDLLSTFSAFTGDATAMGMFEACTSLLESPIIPNMSIGSYGLWGMFISCSSLSACTCLLTNSYIGGNETDYMLSGVAASGTFYKNPNATWQYSDASIPSGWSIQDYSG